MTHCSEAIKESAGRMFPEKGLDYRDIAERLEISASSAGYLEPAEAGLAIAALLD